MSRSRVWRGLLGVERTGIEAVEIEEGHRLGTAIVARVRPFVGRQGRCGICQRRCGRPPTNSKPNSHETWTTERGPSRRTTRLAAQLTFAPRSVRELSR